MIRFNPFKQIPKVNFTSQNPMQRYGFGEKQDKDNFQLSVGYINDGHGQTNNELRILSGIEGDIRLSGGDDQIGNEKNHNSNAATILFLQFAKIVARAMGNHEMDTMTDDFCDLNRNHSTSTLAINFREKTTRPDKTDLNDVLKSSMVTEVKGEKIGLIGACPNDIFERVTNPDYIKDCEVDNYYVTLQKIKSEVEKMEKEGINKIFLLSHLGHNKNKDIAEKIDGIDVIIGGHTHELIKDIKEGDNLIYSPSGKPVIITQAGKDGHYFGLLNLEFDKDGVIKRAQNNIHKTHNYPKSYVHEYIFNQVLGPAEVVGEVSEVIPPPENIYISENPHANFVCDAIKEITGADIGLWNNSGIRNYFHVGKINNREVKDIAPFSDDMTVVPVTEKELVDAFKLVTKRTLSRASNKPGLYAVSGLTYTVSKSKKELVAMNFIDKNGNVIPIDIDNPDPNKVYKVAADEFITMGGDDIPMLDKINQAYKIYPYDKDIMVCQYLKDKKEPVKINQTGRLTIVD